LNFLGHFYFQEKSIIMKNTGDYSCIDPKKSAKCAAQVLDFDYLGATPEILFEKFKTSQKGLSEEEAKSGLINTATMNPLKRKKNHPC
jgi:hypothetical protein